MHHKSIFDLTHNNLQEIEQDNLKKKQWKARNKDKVTAICGCDVDIFGNGQKLLVLGFESGQIEVRSHISGENVFTRKIEGAGSVAKIFFYDYRMNG